MEKKGTEKKGATTVVKEPKKTPAVVGKKVVSSIDTYLEHSEKLASFTKTYKWLVERENGLKSILEDYLEYEKMNKNQEESIFENKMPANFDYRIIVMKGDRNYNDDALVKITKPIITGAFVNTLLQFVQEEKNRVLAEITKLEKEYVDTLSEKR